MLNFELRSRLFDAFLLSLMDRHLLLLSGSSWTYGKSGKSFGKTAVSGLGRAQTPSSSLPFLSSPIPVLSL